MCQELRGRDRNRSGAVGLIRSLSLHKQGQAAAVDVLVTQGWGRIAYNIVRSLGRQGLKVDVGFDRFRGMAAISRYTHSSFFHPSFISHTPQFIQCVREAVQSRRPKVYIPADQEALVVAKYRSELSDLPTEVPVAPFAVLRRLHKKDDASLLATSLDIPTPETLIPKSESDIRACLQEWGDPIVLKRLSSSGARGVFYLRRDSLSEFLDATSAELRFGNFLVQRFVRGTGYGVSMLFNHGQPRARFTHKRLREKFHSGGISTLRISTANGMLEDYAERLLSSVKFHGVAMVEFKFDETTQQAWLLEVNPRFWGSLALAIQSGVDFPFLLYRMAAEGDVPPVVDYAKGVKVRWILGDILGITNQLRNLRRTARHAEKSTVTGFDDFYWDDPLPFLGEIMFSAWKLLKTRNDPPELNDLGLDQL
jgi:predicted ATP-grasp superfamily ATP-dependent carboligase